jgi:hypothetical protein
MTFVDLMTAVGCEGASAPFAAHVAAKRVRQDTVFDRCDDYFTAQFDRNHPPV